LTAGNYDFELSHDDATTVTRRSIYLPDLSAAWPLVAGMALEAQRGTRIRVFDKDGQIVILTGVAAARMLSGKLLAA